VHAGNNNGQMATLAGDEVRFQQSVHVHHVIFVSLKTEFRGVHAGSVLSLYMQVLPVDIKLILSLYMQVVLFCLM
jgi:hypothetical protein